MARASLGPADGFITVIMARLAGVIKKRPAAGLGDTGSWSSSIAIS